MSRYICLMFIVAMSVVLGAADAQTARQARAEVEASMLVTGHVEIDPAGHVVSHTLDQPGKLPPYVVDLIDRAVPSLRFEPILERGVPVAVRSKMGLRLVATPAGDGDMRIRLRSAHFGETAAESEASGVRALDMKPPHYPESIARMGGKGIAYLLVKIDRDGRVEDVVAEQVNLTAIGTLSEMDRIRNALSRNAVVAARRWTFSVPTEGEDADRGYWVIRVPVEYTLHDDRETEYGAWSAYHPGPRLQPDWARPVPEGFSPDALTAGAVAPEASRFRLLTPIEG